MAALAVSLGLAATPTAGGGLLRPAAGGVSAEKRLSLEADPYVMRWRVARIDSDAAFSATAASEPLAFRLFDDVHLRAQVRRARTLESGSTFLYGTVEGGGHFTLLRHQSGVVVGELQSTLGTYVLSPGTEPDRVLVQQRDVSKLPGCGSGVDRLGPGTLAVRGGGGTDTAASAGRGRRPTAETTSRMSGSFGSKSVDILVVYEQRLEDDVGGLQEFQAAVEHHVAYANQVLDNSGLSHRKLRVVGMEKVELLQNDDGWLVRLDRDDETPGKYNNWVIGVAEQLGADVIHRYVASVISVSPPLNTACGIGASGAAIHGNSEYFLRDRCRREENYALCLKRGRRERVELSSSVSVLGCGAGTFSHEIGHVLGALHDRYTSFRYERCDYNPDECPEGWRSVPADEIFVHALGEHLDAGDQRDYSPPFLVGHFGHIEIFSSEAFDSPCSGQATIMSYGNLFGDRGCRGPLATVPYYSNPNLPYPRPVDPGFDGWRPDVPMGVEGDERTWGVDGPVNASRSIDLLWDFIAESNDPALARLPESCNEGDVARGLLSESLDSSVVLGAVDERKSFTVSVPAVEACVDDVILRVRSLGARARGYDWLAERFAPKVLDSWPRDSVFGVSVIPPGRSGSMVEKRLGFTANVGHYGACSATRRALAVVELADRVRVDWDEVLQKVPGTVRHGMALRQGAEHSFCQGAPARSLRRMGDFNGDGGADALLRHTDGRWRYYRMGGAAGDGARNPVSSVLPDGEPASLPDNPTVSVAGVGDFNGDGRDDVLMRLASGSWRYYPMDGGSVLPGRGQVALPTDLAWEVEGIGDFNGDGKDDVLMRRLNGLWPFEQGYFNQWADDWRYYAMDGRNVLGEGSPAGLGSERTVTTWVAGIGDFNGDGNDDTLLRRLDGTWHYFPWTFYGPDYRQVGLFEGHGAVALPDDLAWTAAGIADFDGDGKDDVLLRHEDGRWQYRLMDGRNVLAEGEPDAAALPDDPTVWLAGVGDLDGDGKAEVLTRRGYGAWRYSTWDAASGALVLGGEVALASDPAWGVLRGGVEDPPEAAAVAVPDAGLREHIARSLGLASGAPITQANLARLRELRAPLANVADLAGLELAVNLVTLDLSGNEIADVSALSGLGALRAVDLAGNRLAEVSALAGLAELAALDLSGNGLADVSALSGLAALTELDLSGNRIGDVSPLAGLAALTTLHLDGNAIADVSALGSLDRLSVLVLRGNAVGDISPLLDSGLAGADGYVDLRGNPLGDQQLDHVLALREAGAAVLFDDGGHRVALFPSAAAGAVAGFVRVINHSDEAGAVSIEAVDEAGERRGPASLAVGAREALHFNAGDLERGDSARGLRGIGEGVGGWRLVLRSALDIEVLGYARTPDGFVTSLHDLVPESYGTSAVATFNPGSNRRQVSRLRLINPTAWDRRAAVSAWDDAGSVRANELLAPANRTLELGAAQLEAGQTAGEGAVDFAGIGDGAGKWRLDVHAPGQRAMSLLQSPTGHLANISTRTAVSPWRVRDHLSWERGGRYRVPLFLAAASDIQGFLRLVNLHEESATITLRAIDGAGAAREPATLTLGGGEVLHFTSTDLENGNAAKGLPGIGAGAGDWHLEASADRRFEALAYARTADGFVTSLHDVAPQAEDGSLWIPFFNPGSNRAQASRLRLVNWGETEAEVTITGIDDAGHSPGSAVRVRVPGRSARDYMAWELESGEGAGLSGALGDGRGKWRLRVSSPGEIQAMSLLGLPTGHITNLSTTPRYSAE